MATWHQQRLGPIEPLFSLWQVVVDPPGEFRFSVTFHTEQDAHSYAEGQPHAYVLPPSVTLRVTRTNRGKGHSK